LNGNLLGFSRNVACVSALVRLRDSLRSFIFFSLAFSSLSCVPYIVLIDKKIGGDVCGIGTELYILILYNLFLKK